MDIDARDSDPLLLGPLLRHVDETSATIWVQTAHAARVRVRAGGRSWGARTFSVFGFHYALVVVDGLEPGSVLPYAVDVDSRPVWPPPGSPFPASAIATLDRGKPTRLAFGSCRTSSPHDEEGNKVHGVDALRAYALKMAKDDSSGWPDLCIFLGDQIYADEEISAEMKEFIRARRDISEPPHEEVKDYVEYDHLYRLAWSDPAVRWALSTIPSAMIFDDHDVRDDWNTSWSWRSAIRQESWWQERITSALASYWVYQHIGNLDRHALAADALWARIADHEATQSDGELDITAELLALAIRADEDPETYRWSYTRDLGESQLLMIDSRAARKLDPDGRHMLDDDEMAWLDENLRGDCDHLFIGTSLPFLLPPGLHDFEAWNEAMAQGGWGRGAAKVAERIRRAIDLEHWAAFNDGFTEVMDKVMQVARGERGRAPDAITFLSGDVHNSYLAEVLSPHEHGAKSLVLQAVCSPMRNPMPQGIRVFMSLFARGLVGPMHALTHRTTKVPDPAYPWKVTRGPWFDNNLAICEVDGAGLWFRWYTGEVTGDNHTEPTTRVVADICVGEVGWVRGGRPRHLRLRSAVASRWAARVSRSRRRRG